VGDGEVDTEGDGAADDEGGAENAHGQKRCVPRSAGAPHVPTPPP
jgi:hypothetical protein